jgi:hypothetical protein
MARFTLFLLLCFAFAGFSTSATAAPLAPCNANFTLCGIVENTLLQLPFTAISGDAIVLEPSPSTAVSDVFRIFNNLADTSGGTGLGNLVFLFSVDDGPLPDPSTYSQNAITIREPASGYASFNGNGTVYVLAVPEPSTLILLGTGLAAMLIWRARRPAVWRTLWIFFVLMACTSLAALAQEAAATIDPLPPERGRFRNAAGTGPAQSGVGSQATGLAFFTDSYNSLGTALKLPFNIVGSNPASGAATTTIPTVIVPIKVMYQTAGNISLDGHNVVPAVQNSPIFLTADYAAGATDLGVTQYGDALQRAQFWNLPGFSQNYHVLLGTSTIASTVTLTVTSPAQGNLYPLSSGGLLGVVTASYLDSLLDTLVSSYTADVLPIFLTDNVYEAFDGTINTCCILGYHSSEGPPASTAKTWIYAAYTEAGTFRNNVIIDVQALSHEVAEWLNDPFVGAFAFGFLNIIPPAILPGQGGACIINFETGDPLEAPPVSFPVVTNGTTYHVQDEVFLPWYLHTTPSFSVNGWYTLLNTFTTFSSLCGPG